MFSAIISSNTSSATPSFFSPSGNLKAQMFDLVALSHRSLRFWYYLLFQSFFSTVLEIDSSLISTLLSSVFLNFGYCIFSGLQFPFSSPSYILLLFWDFLYFSEIFFPSMCFRIVYCYFLEHFHSSSFQVCLIIPIISVILALASADCLFIYKLIFFLVLCVQSNFGVYPEHVELG